MSWEPAYILLILFSTSVDFFVCNTLTSSKEPKKKKAGLWITITLNLGLLLFFKYFNFFQNTTQLILSQFNIDYQPDHLSILLPVGISFYNFQTLSYSIDVYRGVIPVERHFGKFALFISFFPQLVAGPIERAKDLIPQLNNQEIKFKVEQMKDGVLMFVWGLFKKVVVADNVSLFVDTYYDTFDNQNGGHLLFATYLFAVQIYCDFSGYSDMAIGLAKMLGIELMNNFKTPYFSTSMTSFWRNWHVSLSTWFKDYLYIPLGGNRNGKFQTIKNTFFTMLIAGFWHGANWTFIMWGAINGFFLAFEKMLVSPSIIKIKFLSFINIFIVFNLISFSWIFFRSQSIDQAFSIVSKISTFRWQDLYFVVAENRYSTAIIGCTLLLLLELHFKYKPITHIRNLSYIHRYTIYLTITLGIFLLGSSSGAQFIYFQF
ncbi:MAG: MBOAT family protein [Fluviicola sp.]|nr:MBOAT family protein [Fluviicola sp.]